jgi:hypothetical protein
MTTSMGNMNHEEASKNHTKKRREREKEREREGRKKEDWM